MKVGVKLFARARDVAGADRVELELPAGASVADVRLKLADRFPAMKPLAESLLFAVGTDYAADDRQIADGDDLACFPPVSGG